MTKLWAGDGALLGTFPLGIHPVGVAFDGTNIWIANKGSGRVTRLRAANGTPTTFTVGGSLTVPPLPEVASG